MDDSFYSALFLAVVGIIGGYLFGKFMDAMEIFLARRRELAARKQSEALKNAAEKMADECVRAAEMLHCNAGRYYTCRAVDLINYNYHRTGSLLWVIGYVALSEFARSLFQVSLGLPYVVFFGYMALRCMKRANQIRGTLIFLPTAIDIVDEIYEERSKDKSDGIL